jgi:hypothetical protein
VRLKRSYHVFKKTLSNSSTEPSGYLQPLRARAGRGRQEVMGAVQYSKSGCPDMDVPTSRFVSLSYLLGPWAVDGSFVSYKGI